MRGLILLALSSIIVGAAPPEPHRNPEAQAKLDKYLAGRVEGETRNCLQARHTADPIGIDDSILLFRDGPRIWRTQLSGSFNCGKIDKMSQVVTESSVRMICSGDKLIFFQNGAPGGACYLGKFTLYEKP